VLVAVCARQSTIESTCNDFVNAPDSNTVRSYINRQLRPEKIRDLQQECNQALASQLPFWLQDHPQEVACDLHDEPYYGSYDREDPDNWVCGGEARDGTTHFYRCATAYILRNGSRMTLAVEFVDPKDDLLSILQHLLLRVQALGISCKRLYLDKGFCSIPIMAYLLTQPNLPVLLAAPIRGKKGGTRVLCQGRGSYHTEHTFRSQLHGQLTVPVAVVRTFAKRRHGPRRAQWLVYVLLHMPDLALRNVRKLYRRRFGIESSYRMMEKTRARTTSHNVALRFLFMGLALLILNVWIALHWIYLRIRGPGPRRVARRYFRQDRMLHFLSRAVQQIYSTVTMVNPPNVKSGIY
jgi:putative transposase